MENASELSQRSGSTTELAITVEQLTEETRLLRMSLDEPRDDVVWAARQVLAVGDSIVPGQLRRQHDPLAPDSRASDNSLAAPAAIDEAEDATYCCETPALRWNGDPDYPGIACDNCGYVVAEGGSVVIWRGDSGDNETDTDPPAETEQKQGTLFE